MRIGTKGRPFYRIVVVDERKKRTGAYIDLIGTYNPLTQPKEIKIDQTKVDAWIAKGAQMSTGFMRIVGKAPQRPEQKVKNPGKLRSNTPAAEPAPEAQEAPSEDTAAQEEEITTEEAPAQEQENEEVTVPAEETASESEVEPTPEVTEDAPVAGEEAASDESETPSEEGK